MIPLGHKNVPVIVAQLIADDFKDYIIYVPGSVSIS